ncbi:MAG: hypothetical protein WCK49_07935 [Myxococcaceae bacterium]
MNRFISVFATLCLFSQISSATMEVPTKYMVAGGVLAAIGAGLAIPTTVLFSNHNEKATDTYNGEIAGSTIGWVVCTVGGALLITGLVKKYCSCTAPLVPPTNEPITKDPPTTAPDGSTIVPIDS